MTEELRFNSLTCENFMPYYNDTIYFPNQNGVVIVNGPNAHGKSSLISAIRFVLFGKIEQNLSISEVINYDGMQAGNYSCKVIMDVDYLGNNYKLIRSLSPKPNVVKPAVDSDFSEPRLNVISGNRTLNENEKNHLLPKIMNETVSRFYLFDGELLEEYKNILSSKSIKDSQTIKNAIENILGLPILTNSRDHIKIIATEKDGEFTKASKQNSETKRWGEAIEDQERTLASYKIDLDKAEKSLSDLEKEINECKDIKLKYRGDIELSTTYHNLIEQKKTLDNSLNKLKINRSELLINSWKSILYPKLEEIEKIYANELKELEQQKVEYSSRRELLNKLKASVNYNKCEWCHQELDKSANKILLDKITEIENEILESNDETDITDKIKIARLKVSGISKFKQNYNISLSTDIYNNNNLILEKESEIVDIEIKKGRIEEELSGSKLTDEFFDSIDEKQDKASKKSQVMEQTICNLKEDIDKSQKIIDALNNNINNCKFKNIELNKAAFEKKTIRNILNLFERGISEYRDKKREDVEKSASEYYRKLSSVNVGGLKISENYAVTEYDIKDGIFISRPRSSAGYAHLKAFALIGGIHNNMPIKGPLFLDTPSSRLDKSNTSNLIHIIPELSSQVVLFITDKDFDSIELHNILKDSILGEYNIIKVSPTHSIISKVNGGN